MNLRKALRGLRVAVTLTVLVGGVAYGYRHGDDLLELTRIGIGPLLALFVGLAAVLVATGFTFFLLIATTGVRLKVTEWVGLTFVSQALNYLIPVRLGIVANATYLKRKATISYSRFSSVLVAKAVLFVGTTALLTLATLVYLRPSGRSTLLLAAICAVLIGGSFVPLYIPLIRFRRDSRWFQSLDNAVHGFEEFRSRKGRVLWIALSILLQHLASSLVFWTAFRALDLQITLPIAVWLVSLVSLTSILSITPNNIGIQELVIGYAYGVAGLDFQDGLLAGALIRGVHILLTLVLAPWFTHRLLRSENLGWTSMIADLNRSP